MRLDSVLGYINPEMQMPNTVFWGWTGEGWRTQWIPGWRELSEQGTGVSVEAGVPSVITVTGAQGRLGGRTRQR